MFGLTNETLPLAILFSLIPIIIIGFTEDIYLNISPKYRLIIAALSGLYTVLFFSGPITHIDFLPLKWVFEYHIIATGFTVFAIVGMVNAVNMIDGLNGFSGFQSLAMLSAISFEKVKEAYKSTATKIDMFDGLSMTFKNWRFNLRVSNTEPLVRLNVETRGNKDLLTRKVKELTKILRNK